MKLNKSQIGNLDYRFRIRLINSISGPKPACLIGTKSVTKGVNLGIFNSITHIGSNPALIGFILRPNEKVRRDTYDNILEEKYFTINHVNSSISERSHWTSAKFDSNISEFDVCNLTEEYIDNFYAPFVKESRVKIGLKFSEKIKIKSNNTFLIIGEIINIYVENSLIEGDGTLNLEKCDSLSVGGLNTYYKLKQVSQFPYARVENLPDFT